MRQVSLEVAEHALRDHVSRTGDDLQPYRVVTVRGTLPPREPVFIDMQDVRDELRLRRGRMISVSHAFRLQQWLAAEALIRERWPAHQAHVVSCDMLAGLNYGGLSFFAHRPRRNR